MESSTNNTLKGYQQKIIHLNTQLQSTRNHNQQLKTQLEAVTNDLKVMRQSIKYSHKSNNNLKSQFDKLTSQKQELQIKLKQSQIHRKSLYDHLFIQRPYSSKPSIDQVLYRLNDLQNYQYRQVISQLEQTISKQNVQILNLSKNLSNVNKQFLKATGEYQIKQQDLSAENDKYRETIQKLQELDKLVISKYNYYHDSEHPEDISQANRELSRTNKIIKQRLQLCIKKINDDAQYIVKLHKRISQQISQSALLQQSPKTSYNTTDQQLLTYDYNEILRIVQQKNNIQSQYKILQQRYNKLFIKFPEYSQSQQLIDEILQKHSKINQYEINIKILQNQKEELQKQIKSDRFRYQEKVNKISIKQKQNQQDIINKTIIIKKLNDFIIIMNPHFKLYGYEQIGLSPQQINTIKSNINTQSQHQNYQLQSKHTSQINKLTDSIQIKDNKIRGLQHIIQQNKTKINTLQETIDNILPNINKNNVTVNHADLSEEMEVKYQIFINQIIKIQQQRDSYENKLNILQVKYMKIMAENIRLNHQIPIQPKPINIEIEEVITRRQQVRSNVVLVNCSETIQNFTKQLSTVRQEIQLLKQQHKQQKQSIINNYQSNLMKSNMIIRQVQTQIQSLKLRYLQNNQTQTYNRNMQRNDDKVHHEIRRESMMSIENEEDIVSNQQLDMPPNTLSVQAIQDLGRLLTGHQTLLKNVLLAYKHLQSSLNQSSSHKQQLSNLKSHNLNLQQQLQASQQQLKLCNIRLKQCDKNMLLLQSRLQIKTQQLLQYKEDYMKEQQLATQKINMLQQQVRQYQNMQVQKQTQNIQKIISNGQYYGEEVCMLAELLDKKREEVKHITQQLKQSRKYAIDQFNNQHKQNHPRQTINSKQLLDEQYEQIQQLLNSDANQVLQRTIQVLQNISKNSQ